MAAVVDLVEAIQTVVAMPANIKKVKPEQEECVNAFIKGKDRANGLWKKANISACTVSGEVGSTAIP